MPDAPAWRRGGRDRADRGARGGVRREGREGAGHVRNCGPSEKGCLSVRAPKAAPHFAIRLTRLLAHAPVFSPAPAIRGHLTRSQKPLGTLSNLAVLPASGSSSFVPTEADHPLCRDVLPRTRSWLTRSSVEQPHSHQQSGRLEHSSSGSSLFQPAHDRLQGR